MSALSVGDRGGCLHFLKADRGGCLHCLKADEGGCLHAFLRADRPQGRGEDVCIL